MPRLLARRPGTDGGRDALVLAAGIGLADFGIASLVAVPLIREGVLRASLYVNQDEVRDWQPAEVALIEEVIESSAATWT